MLGAREVARGVPTWTHALGRDGWGPDQRWELGPPAYFHVNHQQEEGTTIPYILCSSFPSDQINSRVRFDTIPPTVGTRVLLYVALCLFSVFPRTGIEVRLTAPAASTGGTP